MIPEQAHRLVRHAIQRGELVRGICAHGGDCKGGIEGHHFDYDRPLDVLWLCRKHHADFHRKERAISGLRLRYERLEARRRERVGA